MLLLYHIYIYKNFIILFFCIQNTTIISSDQPIISYKKFLIEDFFIVKIEKIILLIIISYIRI